VILALPDEIATQGSLFRIQQPQRPNALLKVLELLDELLGTIVLLLFPILKSLYGSKSLDRPNLDNRVRIIVKDLLLGDRLARSDYPRTVLPGRVCPQSSRNGKLTLLPA